MKYDVVVLRPEPGAGVSAGRATKLGLRSLVSPLFEIQDLEWQPPAAAFDAILFTSANAARYAGDGLSEFLHLPCYAVGETTAAAAHEKGFPEVRVGGSDGQAIARKMADRGIRSAFHPCGRDHLSLDGLGVRLTSVPVYELLPTHGLPEEAIDALKGGALALIHSPAAGRRFRAVIDQAGLPASEVHLAAISEAAGAAAGEGWRLVSTAGRPRDEALLELASKLCKANR